MVEEEEEEEGEEGFLSLVTETRILFKGLWLDVVEGQGVVEEEEEEEEDSELSLRARFNALFFFFFFSLADEARCSRDFCSAACTSGFWANIDAGSITLFWGKFSTLDFRATTCCFFFIFVAFPSDIFVVVVFSEIV